MDPLSVTASVITVLQLAQILVKNIQSIKDSSKERQSIRDEVIYLSGLLFNLQSGLKRKELSPDIVSSLNTPSGPLAQLKDALESLSKLLLPTDGLKRIGQSINWAFQKDYVASLLSKIERQKTFILFALENNQVKLAQNIQHEVWNLRDGVDSVQKAVSQLDIKQQESIDTARTKLTNETLAWLSTFNFLATHNDIQSQAQKDSCRWFLESLDYRRWRQHEKQLLWCWGPPGYGKTFLASQTFQNLRADLPVDEAVVCIFCDYKDKATMSKAGVIASVLQQLSQKHTFIREAVSTMYTFHQRMRTRPDVTQLQALLSQELQLWSKVYVVVDALDEFGDVDFERLELIEILATLEPSVQLLFTSRVEPPSELKTESLLAISASGRNAGDLESYIRAQIQKPSRLNRLLEADIILQDRILNSVLETAQGMFLLAKLQMDLLTRSHTKALLLKTLKSLPTGLDQFYEQVLMRVTEQDEIDSALAKRILIILAGVYRPLRLAELQHALYLLSGDQPNSDEIQELGKENMIPEDTLTSVCLGLVTIKKQVDEVVLVHSTLHHYLKKICLQSWSDTSEDLPRVCLESISLRTLSSGPCQNDEEMKTRLASYPFLRYAGRYWGRHLQSSRATQTNIILDIIRQDAVRQSIVQLMHLSNDEAETSVYSDEFGWLEDASKEYRRDRHRARWIEVGAIDHSQQFPRDVSTLQIASHFGFTDIVIILLEKGNSVYDRDSYGWTALHRASENGHIEVVKILLENTADTKVAAAEGGTALHRAAKKGHQDIVELLVSMTPVDSLDHLGSTPLHRAARHGHSSILLTLMKHKANINARSEHFDLVQHMVQLGPSERYSHSFDQDDLTVLRKVSGGTPIHEAVANGHVDIADILIKAGASLDITDTYGGYPLHRAAAEGHLAVVELLMKSGAAFCMNHNAKHQQTWHYYTSLINGHIYFIMFEFWGTPLHLSSRKGHVKVVELLLMQNADIEIKDFQGQTALTTAAVAGSIEVMKLLLKHGARIDGSTELAEETSKKAEQDCWARNHTRRDHKFDGYSASSKQRMLRKIGRTSLNSSLIISGHLGLTPLHDAAWYGQLGAVRLLIEHGAEINRQDGYGCTPLMLATLNAQHSSVMVLIEYQADMTIQDDIGRTPLKAACVLGDDLLVGLFLDSGLDIDAQEKASNLLLTAADHKRFSTVQLLLDRGATASLFECPSDESDNEFGIFERDPPIAKSWPILWLTANSGKVDLFRRIFQQVPSANLTVSDLNALAHRAFDKETIEFLLNSGAEINSTGDSGSSLLFGAISRGIEFCKMLVGRGVDVNIRDDRGVTALTLACERSNGEDLILLLITAGANVNDNQPLTYINYYDWYYSSTWKTMVQLLLENGCDPNAMNVIGNSALMMIVEHDHLDGIEMMIKHGGDPEITNNAGESAVSRALGANIATMYDRPMVSEGRDKVIFSLLAHCRGADSLDDRLRILEEARKVALKHVSQWHQSRLEECLTPQRLRYWASLGKEPIPKEGDDVMSDVNSDPPSN